MLAADTDSTENGSVNGQIGEPIKDYQQNGQLIIDDYFDKQDFIITDTTE